MKNSIEILHERIVEIQVNKSALEVEQLGLLEKIRSQCSHPKVVLTRYQGTGCNDHSYRGICLQCWEEEESCDAPLDKLGDSPSVWITAKEFDSLLKGKIVEVNNAELKFGKFEIGKKERQFSII